MIRIENVLISDETIKELEIAQRESREKKAADPLLTRKERARFLCVQDEGDLSDSDRKFVNDNLSFDEIYDLLAP
jgi:hypothetical protein